MSDTLTLRNVQAVNAGPYYVLASNLVGVAISSVAFLTVTADDSDGDGIPDAWELANGTDPMTKDAGADRDFDGFSNLQKHIAGTSPTNAFSLLKFDSVWLNGGNVEFSFATVSNRTYAIQVRSAADGGPWQSWTSVPATPVNRAVWLTNAISDFTNQFLRLVTPAQP